MNTFRKLFGPSKKEIWQKLSTDLQAQFVDGGFWKGDKVQVTHGEWIITLDTYAISTGKSTIVFTRMRAPYVNPDRFRFTIYRRGIFSDLGKWLGFEDIVVGHPDFDRDFIIKGSDHHKLRELFNNARLRELVAAQPHIKFEVKDNDGFAGPKFPADTDELNFSVCGVIKDIERLKLLFDLFAETLDQLCHIGSADESAPQVKL